MTNDLLPCPFCGGKAYKKASDVFCENPRCGIYEKRLNDTAWNTRTPNKPAEGDLVAALEAIHDLTDKEIKARFKCSDRSESDCGRGSVIYSMLSVPRNIAAAALSGHLATGKGGDAVAWQVYNELVKEWTTAYADKAKADQLVKDGYKVRPLYAALTGDCGGGDLEPIDCLEEAIALSASACYMEGVRAYYDTTWIEALVEAARRYLALTADNAKRGE